MSDEAIPSENKPPSDPRLILNELEKDAAANSAASAPKTPDTVTPQAPPESVKPIVAPIDKPVKPEVGESSDSEGLITEAMHQLDELLKQFNPPPVQ